MTHQWNAEDCVKRPDLQARYQHLLDNWSNQQVVERYTKETLKLKTLNRFGRTSEKFLGYPNTAMMHRCKQELDRRGLPLPQVDLPKEEVANGETATRAVRQGNGQTPL